ncbi:hypothetical protein RRF57_004917 [Xylaria bambusicola]|uniref:Uncharacterized protein n=1 Tax=Xylaria bambusicola TaxID=326684 RepID=A0AAN7UIJ1_9PEZI
MCFRSNFAIFIVIITIAATNNNNNSRSSNHTVFFFFLKKIIFTMTTMMTSQLTKEEVERREKVRAALAKAKPGMERERAFGKIVQSAENGAVKGLLGQKQYPFVSAAYLNWEVDEFLWNTFGEKDAVSPIGPEPRLYGQPYSVVYVKAYFEANPTEEEKKAKENKEAMEKGEGEGEGEGKGEGKGKGKEPETPVVLGHRYGGFTGVSTHPVDPLDLATGEVVDFAVLLSGAPLDSRGHAPLQERVRLYQELAGKAMPYQEGCGPFQIECPFSALGQEFAACFGRKEDMSDLLMEATLFIAGGYCEVLVFAKFRHLVNGDSRVSLFLDWHIKADLDCPAWRRTLYQAWCALLALYNSQLKGIRIGLMEHLKQYYGEQMRSHLTLINQIGANVHQLNSHLDARRRAAEAVDGANKMAEMESLLAKMERFALEVGKARVAKNVGDGASYKEKLDELVKLATNPEQLHPIAYDPYVRAAMVLPTAQRLLIEQVLFVLEGTVNLPLKERLGQVMSFVTDDTCPWALVLPLDERYRIVAAEIWKYQRDLGVEDGFDMVRYSLDNLDSFFTKKRIEQDQLVEGVGNLSLRI